MKLPLLAALLGASCFPEVVGHAKLISPTPRGGVAKGRGEKMRPFDEAGEIANAKMSGGKDPACPGAAGKPSATYKPGQKVTVKWSVTIPHERDRKNSGVRIALRYNNEKDSFRDNILAGYVQGDPKDDDGKTMKKVDAGSGETESYTVTLPKGKKCKSCTLQWMWAAKRDGGFYLGCADIAITDAGSSERRRRRSKTGSTRRRRNKTGSTRRRRGKKGSRRRRSKRSGSTRRRRGSKSGKVKAKACDDSKPQKCKMKCKPLMCPPKQCAMRMDSCCDLKCKEPK